MDSQTVTVKNAIVSGSQQFLSIDGAMSLNVSLSSSTFSNMLGRTVILKSTGVTSTFYNVTVSGSQGSDGSGSAFFVGSNKLTSFRSCRFSNNRADIGGVLACKPNVNCNIVIEDCISNNNTGDMECKKKMYFLLFTILICCVCSFVFLGRHFACLD